MNPLKPMTSLIACLLLAALMIPAQGQDTIMGPTATAEQLVADRLVQEAILGLENIEGQPRDDQLECAAILMDLALEMDKNDPELWRLRKELAQHQNDGRTAERALKQYIRLVPEDDHAQLELVLGRLDELNTLDERRAMLERILASRSIGKFSDALRSRLHGYAAISANEAGDPSAMRDHLRRAMKLDPANETAAVLVYDYVQSMDARPEQYGAINISLIEASPLSHQARNSFANTLASQAAYERAAEQFSVASGLASMAGLNLPRSSYDAWYVSLVGAGRIEDARAFMDEARRMAAAQGGADPEAEALPQPPLPLDMAVMQLAVLDGDELTAAYDQLRTRLTVLPEEEDGEGDGSSARTQLAWIAALFGQDLDQVRDYLQGVPQDSRPSIRARGWLLLHKGETEQARAVFDEAPDDPLCRLGTAATAGLDEAGNTRALLEVVHEYPTTLAAALACRRIQATGRQVASRPAGKALIQLMDRQPNELWRMDLRRSPWMQVKLSVEPRRFAFCEPITAHVTLRNASLLPVSLGDDRTVRTTGVLSITPSVSGITAYGMPPLVFDAARRLTLKPGQELTFPVRLDHSAFAALLDRQIFQTFAFSTEAILNPYALPSGVLKSGVFGDSAKVRINQAWALPATEANVQAWIEQLDSSDALERYQALGRLAHANADKPGAAGDGTVGPAAAEAVNERFADLSALERAWVMLFASGGESGPLQPSIDIAKRSDEPLVRLGYLLGVVEDAESPALASAMRHENRTIRSFAANYKTLLATNAAERQAWEEEQAATQQEQGDPEAPAQSTP